MFGADEGGEPQPRGPPVKGRLSTVRTLLWSACGATEELPASALREQLKGRAAGGSRQPWPSLVVS
jgi:hypothetical protein